MSLFSSFKIYSGIFFCFILYNFMSVAYAQTDAKTTHVTGKSDHKNLQLENKLSASLSPCDFAKHQQEKGFYCATLAAESLVILRFDPKYFDFVLHSIGSDNSYPKTLEQWTKDKDLVAAINASMYLPDGKTSTGYMRNGTYVNNKKMAKKFGAIFLANPKDQNDASAKIIEKSSQNLQDDLDKYQIAVQNFRLIDTNRKILWADKGAKHSIAAIGQDIQGRILFFHSQKPIQAYAFATLILNLPLEIQNVMYVEGGVQAGLTVHMKNKTYFWGGRHPANFFLGNVAVALPNIIGVKRKKQLIQ